MPSAAALAAYFRRYRDAAGGVPGKNGTTADCDPRLWHGLTGGGHKVCVFKRLPSRAQWAPASGAAHGPFDLLVVADSVSSHLRNTVSAPRVDKPYPWGALWCPLPPGTWPDVPARCRAEPTLRGRTQESACCPVGGQPGDPTRRPSFFWSLHIDAFQQWEASGLWPKARDVFAASPHPASSPAPAARPRREDGPARRRGAH